MANKTTNDPSLILRDSLTQAKNALRNFLGTEENALKFMSAAMHCLQTTPGLLECTQESLIGAFMECATIGLFPSNWRGDCYILPYRTKNGTVAQFQMGYKGFKTLAYRNGVSSITAEIVHKKDKFEFELGANPKLVHQPDPFKDRGEPIGVYAVATIGNEAPVFKVMSKADVMKIKAMSKAKDAKFSPWNSNDPENWMWKKTAIKQLAKLLPTTEKLDRAIYLDNVSERGGYIEREGKVVEIPFTEEQKIEAVSSRKAEMRLNQAKNDVKTTENPEENNPKNEDDAN